jgi:hypothetical protein
MLGWVERICPGTPEAPDSRQALAAYYVPPQTPGESNYYIDMWGGTPLRAAALAAGLFNNHALLINSHGKAVLHGSHWEYVYFARSNKVDGREFSNADIAAVLGVAAMEIHNIVLSGCNKEDVFSAADLRRYFVNATNIVHAPAGQLGYQPMFFQALFNVSSEVRPLYEVVRENKFGQIEYDVDYTPQPKSTLLSPYIAELFEPGKSTPYRIQIAGRELLGPLQ